jgi:hypothetical protein
MAGLEVLIAQIRAEVLTPIAGLNFGAWDAARFKSAAETNPLNAVLSDLGISGSVASLVTTIFKGNYVVSKSNKLIYNVPKSDEVVNRVVSVMYAKSLGMTVADLSVASGNLYNAMPASERDKYLALLNVSDAEKAALGKWDERVDKIREVLSEGPGSAASGIAPANIVRPPTINTVSSFSSYPSAVQSALKSLRTSSPMAPVTTGYGLSVVMRGGNANPHAPLYPRLVMNGGAHPLASFAGGEPDKDAAVKAITNRISALKEQFKAITGKDLPAGISGEITNYSSAVKDGLASLQDKLTVLSKANAALAQYPPGLGINASNFDEQKLKDLTKQADDLNEAAKKSAKQFDKLSQIEKTLEELVSKLRPAVASR